MWQPPVQKLVATSVSVKRKRSESLQVHHVAADDISFAATFLQKSLLAHFVAAPFQTRPALLGSRLVFGCEPEREWLIYCTEARRRGFYIVRDDFFIQDRTWIFDVLIVISQAFLYSSK